MGNPFIAPPDPWSTQPDSGGGVLDTVGDIAAAPFRGAVDFAQGVYGLANTVTGSNLPDWQDNPLGKSSTLLGGLVEGGTQFMLGFIPIVGEAGVAGKLGSFGQFLSEGGLLGKAGWGAAEGLAGVGRGLVGGALTDFAVWQGHQERLSNLIQSNPDLANPITEFLAAKDEDPELLGRLKGALEGAGVGAAVEGLLAGIRKVAVYGRARAEALSKVKGEPTFKDLEAAHEEAVKAADAAVPDAEIKAATDAANADSAFAKPEEKFNPSPIDPAEDAQLRQDVPTVDKMIEPEAQLAEVVGLDVKDRPRGADAIMQRLWSDMSRFDSAQRTLEAEQATGGASASALANVTEKARPDQADLLILHTFINRVGTHLFNDTAISIRKLQGAGGEYDAVKDIVTLGKGMIDAGQLQWTGLHELWHGLSRFIGTEDTRAVEAQFVKERAAYLTENPLFAETLAKGDGFVRANYRFKNIDEWFAETMTEKTLDRFAAEKNVLQGSAVQKVVAQAKLILGDIVNGIRAKFGGDSTDAMLKRFLDGGVDGENRNPLLLNDVTTGGMGHQATETKLTHNADGTVDINTVPVTTPKVDFGGGGGGLGRASDLPPEAAGAGVGAAGEAAPRSAPNIGGPGESVAPGAPQMPPVNAQTELGHALAAHMANLVKYGLPQDALQRVINTVDSVLLRHSMEGVSVGTNPRNLTGPQILNLALEKTGFNLEHYTIDDRGKSLIRAWDEMFQAADTGWRADAVTEQGFKQQAADGLGWLAQITNADSAEGLYAQIAHTTQAFGLSVNKLAARVYAMRTLMSTLAQGNVEHLDRIAQIQAGSLKGDLALETLVARSNIQQFAQVCSTLRGAKAEIGRALGGMAQDVGATTALRNFRDFADHPEVLDRFLEDAGGKDNVTLLLNKMRAMYGDGGDEGLASFGKAANVLQQSFARRAFDGFIEFWMGALLSGPKTAAVNAVGPLAYSYFKPMEALLGSAVLKGKAGFTGDAAAALGQSQVTKELYAQAASMHTGLGEAVAAVKRLGFGGADAFDDRPGSSILDTLARRKKLDTSNFPEVDKDSLAGRAIDWLGNAARVPTNVLGTTDSVLKTMNYRAAARGRLESQLLAQPGMTAEAMHAQVQATMDRLIWDHQVYSTQQLLRRGLQEADQAGLATGSERAVYATDYVNRALKDHPEDQALSDFAKAQGWDNTLTTPAQPGSLSATIQNFKAQQPWMQLVLPFVNTPINIAKATGQRLDAIGVAQYIMGTTFDQKWVGLNGSKNRFISEMVSGDPRLQAEAVGRIATGMAAATTMFSLVASGSVTGRGPSDPAHRKTLQDAGWQPYSFRVGDGYVSYSRLDPLASLIGTAADAYEYAQYAPHGDSSGAEKLAIGIAVALTNNLTNKTYVSGLANFIDAAREPDKKLGAFFQRYASSLVPNILGQGVATVGGDDTLRDVNGILDAMINKVPGLSSTLPPQRNVLGEPMSRDMSLGGRVTDWWLPVGYREISDDAVKIAMAQTGNAFVPPPSTYGGMDLNGLKVGETTAYDRWGELQGTVKLGGMSIKDAMRRLVASEAFQQAIPAAMGDTQSPRVDMLNSVIHRYRDAAWRQLQNESPELRAHVQSVITNKLAARRGDLFSLEPR